MRQTGIVLCSVVLGLSVAADLGATGGWSAAVRKPAAQSKHGATLTPQRLYAKLKDSVVLVDTDVASGTGFFYGRSNLVVTCLHVVEGASRITVKGTKGATWHVQGVAFDKGCDCAVLHLSRPSGRAPIARADATSVSVGDKVYVIGNPLGFLTSSLSEGIVSAKRRAGSVPLLQLTAPISPGSSGSPVLDSRGRVVGFVDFYFSEGQALNVAIGSGVLSALAARKPRWVGVLARAAGSSKTTPRGSVELVYVPAGAFVMGSDNGEDDEKPAQGVYLDSYWIGKTDVTVAQFRGYCQDSGYAYDWDLNKPVFGWFDDHPMVNVTWFEARAFCQWTGGDLPTEAQWEKAARGADGRTYPWGDAWEGWKCANSVPPNVLLGTEPVAGYPSGASPYGCLDMAGNVWDWCLDWYATTYGPARTQGPADPLPEWEERVIRGGAWWSSDVGSLRASFRNCWYPSNKDDDVGFRVAAPH